MVLSKKLARTNPIHKQTLGALSVCGFFARVVKGLVSLEFVCSLAVLHAINYSNSLCDHRLDSYTPTQKNAIFWHIGKRKGEGGTF